MDVYRRCGGHVVALEAHSLPAPQLFGNDAVQDCLRELGASVPLLGASLQSLANDAWQTCIDFQVLVP